MPWVVLFFAIVAETIGTTALQASQQFTRPLPSAVVVVAYAVAFYLLGLALKTIPVGIAYAMWSGVGIVCIAMIGRIVFGQVLDLAAQIGIAMILGGILVIQLFSNTTQH